MHLKTKNLTLHFTKASIVGNAVLAVGKLVLAILSFSLFMCINAFYNVGIALAKYFSHQGIDQKKTQKEELEYYRIIGIILLSTSLIFAVYSVRMLIGGKSAVYPEIVGIAIAAFTFAEITLNIKGLLSARKTNNIMLQANKLISLASSLICLVLTQTALMSFAHAGDASVYNGISGIIFGFAAAMIGLYMIINVYRIQNGKTEKALKKRVQKFMKKSGVDILPLKYEDAGENGRILHVKIDDFYSCQDYIDLKEKVKKKMNLELIYIQKT